jgi:rhomboid protease GluP
MSDIEPIVDSAPPETGSVPPETDSAPPEISSARPEASSNSLCTHLARQFLAKKGFEVARVPEVASLYQLCEIVLTRSDGFSFGVLCMVDRDARPEATFPMPIEELEAIGQACLQYAGKVNGRTMPVSIHVIEVGPASADQAKRLQAIKRSSLFAKVIPSAMIVDTTSNKVWSNGGIGFLKGPYHRFVEKILISPREADADLAPPAVITAPRSFPLLTTAILAVLFAVFAAEIAFGIGPWTKLLQPTIATLVAFGGLSRDLVLQLGDWYRLLSAPFLHLDAGHLAMNAIGLFLAGRALEWLIGRAWFGAVYFVGALTGSLLSLALNSASDVSVGASGAIMGLFATMLVISAHYPPGAIRTGLQMNAIYVLVPSLLPFASVLKGERIDYAAHFGGAIGGTIVGLVLLWTWSKNDALPRFRHVAAAIAIAGLAALTYPVLSVLRGYQAMAFTTQLIPPDELPRSGAEMKTHSAELIAQYPRDPRPRFLRSIDLLNAGDLAGAEREARAGLAEESLWHAILPPQLGNGLRIMLAIALNTDRRDEALATARPACATVTDGPMRKMLDERNLCGT